MEDEVVDDIWHSIEDVIYTASHSMDGTLPDYILPKVHSDIQTREWSRILVVGSYRPDARATDTEKRHKLFNWSRPTTTELEPTVLQLNCFPGPDYVQHYAHLVANYLATHRRNLGKTVLYKVPSNQDCMRPFSQSNLGSMGKTDIVVVGYVEHLRRFLDGQWHRGGSQKDGMFAWQQFTTPQCKLVSLLGCVPSFWGDISGHFVRALQQLNQVKCILYVGKAGTLHPEHTPNKVIATGSSSFLGTQKVQWTNVLEKELEVSSMVQNGEHVTVTSPLCETLSWLEEWQSKCSWADCEVGHMAKAANERGTSFGYLHIISDNVAKPYPYDLSNEHLQAVRDDRQKLFTEIEIIFDAFFSRWEDESINIIQ